MIALLNEDFIERILIPISTSAIAHSRHRDDHVVIGVGREELSWPNSKVLTIVSGAEEY